MSEKTTPPSSGPGSQERPADARSSEHPVAAPDPLVQTAFSLGWQMAQLYRPGPRMDIRDDSPTHLPGIGDLAAVELRGLRLNQIDVALARLRERIMAAGQQPPSTTELRDGAETDQEAVGKAVLALHIELLATLTASDRRLGIAYALGRELHDTCEIGDDNEDLGRKLGHDHLTDLYSWALDLKSALPPHAGECIYQSLRQWETWWATEPAPLVAGRPLDWERDGQTVRDQLQRQGEIWRAVLSGEKDATDTLDPTDYVTAGRQLAGSVLRQLPWWLWVVVVALLGAAIAALVIAANSDEASSVIAALGGVAATLGITVRSVQQTLGRAVERMEDSIWGAALDKAIVVAITRVQALERLPEERSPLAATLERLGVKR